MRDFDASVGRRQTHARQADQHFAALELAYAPRMGHAPEDSALMLRYKDGDSAAFETLYRRHNDALYRYSVAPLPPPATAEDVFQDVWGKIIKARANYRPTAKFTTFMYRVAHNCFIDHVRRNKRHANNARVGAGTARRHVGTPGHKRRTQPGEGAPASRLHDLPEEQRDAFLLHEEAGLNIDQIAAVTGSNRETAKSRLRYAVNKLRAAIEEPQ